MSIGVLVTGLRCYNCMPKQDNSSEILDCMNSTTDFGKYQRCDRSKNGSACMLTSSGKVFKIQKFSTLYTNIFNA